MWACGIIMYQILVGAHPMYQHGVDTSQTFSDKLHSFNPSVYVSDESVAGIYFNPMARDLFIKLCNPLPFERYTAEQALRHPWITRDHDSPIPLTQSQKMKAAEAHSLMKTIVTAAYFLSLTRNPTSGSLQDYRQLCERQDVPDDLKTIETQPEDIEKPPSSSN